MWDPEIAALAAGQFNRVSRAQLAGLGMSFRSIEYRLTEGRLVQVHEGVFGLAPVLDHDQWGRWMGATLTSPGTFLSQESAARAWGALDFESKGTTVTRPGNGGPRRLSGVVVYRSVTLAGETTTVHGIPITTPERTLLDLACRVSRKTLAKALRQFVRLGHVTLYDLTDWLEARRRRRGVSRLRRAIATFGGLSIERARSGAEVRALEILRDAGRKLPRLNVRIAGEEADLSWPEARLIIEVDGEPFHQDRGEDARKEAAWANAGWRTTRIDANDVYEHPHLLLRLAPT